MSLTQLTTFSVTGSCHVETEVTLCPLSFITQSIFLSLSLQLVLSLLSSGSSWSWLSEIGFFSNDDFCFHRTKFNLHQFSPVEFSLLVMINSLWHHGLQHTRLTCPSPTTGSCSNSCPSSRWSHPSISPSVALFSSSLQTFPASGSFLMSQFFISHGQSIGASLSVLPMNIQDWFPLGLTDWSPCYPEESQESSSTHQFKNINSLVFIFPNGPTLTSIHDFWKNQSFD